MLQKWVAVFPTKKAEKLSPRGNKEKELKSELKSEGTRLEELQTDLSNFMVKSPMNKYENYLKEDY